MEIDTVDNRYYFENYLEITGWGFYNKFQIGFICLCNFIHGVTFVTIPLAGALLICEKEKIAESTLLWIFTGYYIGCCFGSLIMTFLADRYGRKKYLIYTLIINFLSTFSAAFTYDWYILTGAVIFLGVGLQSNQIIAKILLAENLPKHSRGFYILFSHIFWAIGYILTTILTISLSPSPSINLLTQELKQNMDFHLKAWRLMFAICGGLNLLLACACALIEESPRYYLQSGRTFMAHLILKQIYAINKSDFAENFPVKEEDIRGLLSSYDLTDPEATNSWDNLMQLMNRFETARKLLFSTRFRRTTYILIVLKMSIIIIGLLHLNTVISKMLAAKEDFNDAVQISFQTLDFVYPILRLVYENGEKMKLSNICATMKDKKTAKFHEIYNILTCAVLPGLILALFVIDRFGRKILLLFSFILISLSFFILTFIENSTIQLLTACAVLSGVSIAIWTISVIDAELYPTAVRATACSVTNFFGLFFVIFFINFIEIDWKVFNIIMGIVYFLFVVWNNLGHTCIALKVAYKPILEKDMERIVLQTLLK